jgi:hypothetical protein
MAKRYTYRKATAEELASGFPEMIEILVEDLPDADTLEEAKEMKIAQIDSRTQELIFEGFSFAGLHWSLSINAQINWNNLPQLPQTVFPLAIQDMNGVDYDLEFSQRMDFYYTAVAVKNSHLQSGNVLKREVSDMQTIQEISNFVDPR